MALNAGCVLMEPESIVLYNDPLLLCPEENLQEECSLVFKPLSNDTIRNSTIIFDPNIYQFGNESSNSFLTEHNVFNNDISYQSENEARDPVHNLHMMHYFYKNVPKDQPEFVDVNNLTLSETVEGNNSVKESIILSDDENDVVFVKEYKKEESGEDIVARDNSYDSKEEGIRRNPVRKARTNKGKRHLLKEHLLEEDFAVLDQIDEENLIFSNCKSSSSTSSASPVDENFKEWPINCYERPEFDPDTNKIDPLSFNVQGVQKTQQKKKPRLETTTFKKKPKKKYFIRKRKPKAKQTEKRIPISELKDIVDSTFDLVGDFAKLLINDSKSNVCKDDLYNLMKNQIALVAAVNDYGKEEVTKCVSNILGGS